jgi:hypothetical protein
VTYNDRFAVTPDKVHRLDYEGKFQGAWPTHSASFLWATL